MIRFFGVVAGALLIILLASEVGLLVRLKHSVRSYADYWQRTAQQPGDFTYVALGDSTGQAIGASSPSSGYVGLLAADIARQTGRSVRVINLSVTGARITDVTKNQLPQLRQYHPDLVTLAIGANDVTSFNSSDFQRNFTTLARQLPAKTVVADVPYFGGRIRNNNDALAASGIIAEQAAQQHLPLVRLQTATHEQQSFRNYSADLFHPSNHAYQIWAGAFWQVIQPTLPAKN